VKFRVQKGQAVVATVTVSGAQQAERTQVTPSQGWKRAKMDRRQKME